MVEAMAKKTGLKLGIATFFPACVRLSDRIYKICTLLSTGFVDNLRWRPHPAPRRSLSGAGFRAIDGAHWEARRWQWIPLPVRMYAEPQLFMNKR